MIEENDAAVVKLAIWDGFEINEVYGERTDGKTPLLEAIRLPRPDIAGILLGAGADTELKTSQDITPLMYSILFASSPDGERRANAVKIFDMLLDHGADVNYNGTFGGVRGMTPLGQAASGIEYEAALYMTKKLLDAGAEVNPPLPEDHGLPPIFWAFSPIVLDWERKHENRIDMIKLLLAAGADPNTRLPDGMTLLHAAAMVDDGENIKLLLDAGADKRARDKDGKTPFDTAMENSNFEVMLILTCSKASPHNFMKKAQDKLHISTRWSIIMEVGDRPYGRSAYYGGVVHHGR
ncbi:MAG: ankyrin repeat domain-containing protein [Synergistaceae bacterium]|nr:ankyrin repeat domain-containing protein [Synergistaceae bacterium]